MAAMPSLRDMGTLRRRGELGYRHAAAAASIVRRAMVALLLILAGGSPHHAADELDYGLDERELTRLRIEGNASIERQRIEAVLPFREPVWYLFFRRSTFRLDELDLAERAVRTLYQREGYLSVEVRVRSEPNPAGGEDVIVRIDEGPQVLIRRQRILGASHFSEAELQRGLRYVAGAPAPAREADLGEDEFRILQRYVAAGFLLARVQARREVVDSTLVDVRIDIDSGQIYAVREIRIDGHQQTREEHIRRELRLRPGDPFDLQRIADSEAALLERGWFRDVTFVPVEVDSASASAVLEVRVLERPTAFYEIGVGTGDQDRLRLSGAWGDRNLFGGGRSLTLRGRLLGGFEDVLGEGADRKLFFDHEEEVLYRTPHAFGTRFDVNLSGFFRRETLGLSGVRLERFGFLANTPLWRRRSNSLELEGAIERVIKLPLADLETAVDYPRATTRSLSLVFSRDTRDSPLAPTRGSIRYGLVQSAGGWLGGDNHFVKTIANYVKLVNLPAGSILAWRLQAGWEDPFGSSRDRGTPLEARFFAGGSNTVRGYRENSLGPRLTDVDVQQVVDDRFLANRPTAGGNALLQGNAELRLPLPLLRRIGLWGTLFVDAGNVWENWSRVSLERLRPTSSIEGENPTTIQDLRTSVGFGLHYGTPVGPLRLDYGLPLKRARFQDPQDPAQIETDPQHIWHFSLGHAF
jgi:outer membrane protein insertion porin family